MVGEQERSDDTLFETERQPYTARRKVSGFRLEQLPTMKTVRNH